MEKYIPDLNARVKQIIDIHTDGNVRKFADILGFSQQKVNRLFIPDTRTGKYPSVPIDIVSKITEMFVDINPDWLLNDKGEMYRTKNAENVTLKKGNNKGNIFEIIPNMQENVTLVKDEEAKYVKTFMLKTDKRNEHQIIPIYNLEASAGLVKLLDSPMSQNIIDYISIPNLPNCDGAVFVTGDSMYPLLKSGDIVAYKQIHDIINDIFFGEMYILSLQLSGEELVTIKYVQKSEIEGHIKLVSQNRHHDDKDVPLVKIRALALIKASIRYNMMY